MTNKNYMKLTFLSLSENEGFARLAVASFCSEKIKNLEDLSDIKTAVSEAVTNSIVHGYFGTIGKISIECEIDKSKVSIVVSDNGVGIDNVEQARQPFFTSKPEMERSGMGFTVMESFMDSIIVESEKNKGTTVKLVKNIRKSDT